MLIRALLLTLACASVTAAQTDAPNSTFAHWKRLPFGTTATGSTYVPLDSWIYPEIERLIAWGYIDTAYLGQRPWTRLSIMRMLQRAEDRFESERVSSEAREVFDALRKEFEADYREATQDHPTFHAELSSLYERSLGIAGTPINDSFHFGQTLANDYGRPYQEGFNQIAGFTAQAEYGRFSFFVRGEYQYAPGRDAYSLTVRQAISVMDNNPLQPAVAVARSNTFQLLNATAAIALAGNQISIGKSDMWWGPGEGGSFAYSDNAEPINMLRIDRVEPLAIPFISKFLGPIRYDLFLGSLQGHVSPRGPWIQGQKISFKPSSNFEFGVSRTIVFAGEGHVPFTFGSFWNSFSSLSNVPLSVKFSRNDPGARYSSFDFSYRVPFLRNWLTLYSDSLAHDDVSPLSAPRRSAFRPGIYLSHFPHASRLDFRAEAAYTDFPTSRSSGGQFFFFEDAYHDAYTNKQIILGDWIGREGKGGQAWLTYHLSPQEIIQLSYRNAKSASDFVPGGTTQNDVSVRIVHRLHEEVEFNAFGQIEFWKAPILAHGLRSDLSIGIQLTYFPGWRWSPGK
jgi:hypothetical protein